MNPLIFDIELIGTHTPIFMIGVKSVITQKKQFFWLDKPKDMVKFRKMIDDPQFTWVGFNSESFDRPLVAAAFDGWDIHDLKALAGWIITGQKRSWQTYKEAKIDFIPYDHIDLIDVAPGVMISLKLYAGRMGSKLMMDMPFHHDTDLTPAQRKLCQVYCGNDLDVTEMLWKQMAPEMEMRIAMTAEYGIELRSKSDAQIAEAILKSRCGLKSREQFIPRYVNYTTPPFIQTKSEALQEIIQIMDGHEFLLHRKTGQLEVPEFLSEPITVGKGTYQMGVGGLHSTHDVCMHLEATDEVLMSDFDVASYYPNIMMKAGLIPRLGGNKGEIFLDEYRKIYEQRMAAKRAGNKKLANSLKILLNSTFGKLGSLFCSFYSPDLLLAVTLTGQLNLLCLIHELEKIRGVLVKSANTDGILVQYGVETRAKVLGVFAKNAKRTGFEYEETPYRTYAAKDVNNYIAITQEREAVIIDTKGVHTVPAGKVKAKRKGLYGESGVNPPGTPGGKNPTMDICAEAATTWLTDKTHIETSVMRCIDIKKFVSIRNVKGGGIQYDKYVETDDWTPCEGGWTHPGRTTLPEKRKSRPAPRLVGAGGTPFGRVARWYMTKKDMPPLSYVGSGNKVPKTEGARVCMTLPDALPKDIDIDWYINEARAILADCGVVL